MSEITAGRVTAGVEMPALARARTGLRDPAVLFALISLIAGALLVAITPPLRGPDEAQHFLRAFGVAQGDLVPRMLDPQGRKGLYVPAGINRDLKFFEDKKFVGSPGTELEFAL